MSEWERKRQRCGLGRKCRSGRGSAKNRDSGTGELTGDARLVRRAHPPTIRFECRIKNGGSDITMRAWPVARSIFDAPLAM